ncbi:hypothetical protein ACGFJ7_37965 [Actinoplanes sp. NPDC048988]|uniref:hypothetical protein n=1 Tax=Actinoplanes sp. NPDC048988 TaxID=3363901 RepID=UPI0037200098
MPIAQHETVQCTLALASDGRFGCSWNRDFVPLFDSVDAMLEDVAAWGSLQGWYFVGHASDTDPNELASLLGGLAVDEAAYGELSGWWRGHGIAMSFGRHLTHQPESLPNVQFLADSAEGARSIADALSGRLASTWPLERGKTVPRLP